MVGEIPIEYGDLITTEIDTEQEENTEKKKEKTAGQEYDLSNSNSEGLTASLKYKARNQHNYWNPPSIDLHTPPPEQS